LVARAGIGRESVEFDQPHGGRVLAGQAEDVPRRRRQPDHHHAGAVAAVAVHHLVERFAVDRPQRDARVAGGEAQAARLPERLERGPLQVEVLRLGRRRDERLEQRAVRLVVHRLDVDADPAFAAQRAGDQAAAARDAERRRMVAVPEQHGAAVLAGAEAQLAGVDLERESQRHAPQRMRRDEGAAVGRKAQARTAHALLRVEQHLELVAGRDAERLGPRGPHFHTITLHVLPCHCFLSQPWCPGNSACGLQWPGRTTLDVTT
jgi:hypothetical protein